MELKPDQKLVDGVQSDEQPPATENSIAVPQAVETTLESDLLKKDAHSSINSQVSSLNINENQNSTISLQNYDDVNNSLPQQSVSSGSSMSTSSLPLSQTQTPSNAQRPGERLRQTRLLKGREIKEIATELNIHERILVAIEADDYKTLPEPAFIRGYLRAYGRLLGIDSDVLIMQFNELYTSATGLSSNHSLENSPLQQLAKLQSRTRKSKRWMLWLLVPVVLVVIVLILRPIVKRVMGSTTGASAAHTVVLTDNTQTASTQINSGSTTSAPYSPTTAAPLSSLPPVTSTQSSSDQLVLTLSKSSDVSVQDSTGKTLVSGTQSNAQPLTLSGVSPFSINLADAAHVTLSLNGEHVDLAPYTVDGHASFRLSR